MAAGGAGVSSGPADRRTDNRAGLSVPTGVDGPAAGVWIPNKYRKSRDSGGLVRWGRIAKLCVCRSGVEYTVGGAGRRAACEACNSPWRNPMKSGSS